MALLGLLQLDCIRIKESQARLQDDIQYVVLCAARLIMQELHRLYYAQRNEITEFGDWLCTVQIKGGEQNSGVMSEPNIKPIFDELYAIGALKDTRPLADKINLQLNEVGVEIDDDLQAITRI